jgi:4'-phosphopantetheinyl transferase
MTDLSLEENDVHVWYATPEDIRKNAFLDSGDGLLSPDEVDRQRRFSSKAAGLLHRTGRVLVRTTLSRYEEVSPSAWKFRPGPNGRPEIASPDIHSPLRFNLSHTDGMAVCAVARRLDVGIDVESLKRPCRFEQIARRFFPEEEIRDIESLQPEARRKRFLEFWTLREAFLKAGGWGLSLPLNKIAFTIRPDNGATALFDPTLQEDPALWRFRLIPLPPDHTAALAVKGRRDDKLRLAVRHVKSPDPRKWRE